MSFKFSAAYSSRIKKSTKPSSLKRSQSSPFASLPRRKPVQRSATKRETPEDDEDFFEDRLDDRGLVKALAADLTLRDVVQALLYIRRRMFSAIPDQRSGMNSTRTAEVLNYRASLPPLITVSHVQALLDSPTIVEREIAELVKSGTIRKIIMGGRGSSGEAIIMTTDLDSMLKQSLVPTEVKEKFMNLLKEHPTAQKLPGSLLSEDEAKALIHAGFLTFATANHGPTEVFSQPGDGSRGTMTSLSSISKAASGSLAAVGGEGAVHAAGGSGGRVKALTGRVYQIAIPGTGPFLKMLTNTRIHLLLLLSKSRFKEAPESLLRERWDGGIPADDATSNANRNRGEFAGVLPGRTRKWKQFNGISYDWIVEECVGSGAIEVFDTGSVGRAVRAL